VLEDAQHRRHHEIAGREAVAGEIGLIAAWNNANGTRSSIGRARLRGRRLNARSLRRR
jgi:hypothetical protein